MTFCFYTTMPGKNQDASVSLVKESSTTIYEIGEHLFTISLVSVVFGQKLPPRSLALPVLMVSTPTRPTAASSTGACGATRSPSTVPRASTGTRPSRTATGSGTFL